MSSTTIENVILYIQNLVEKNYQWSLIFSSLEESTMKMAINGPTPPFDFAELKRLFHGGEKMSDGNGWNALFFNNHDQPVRSIGL